ncbi:MAG: hypothetical protein IJ060_04180 [Oscillospiraceae bacterium]|nr:hypothetical protein [Oscillospiraceae bacterium]
MNETKYTEIMSGIRRDYIEEAVTWDGSERKHSREIRRMTLGICGIAASIAVVSGFLFFSARKNKPETRSAPPALSESEQNFLGGHGELRPYLSTGDQILLRDAEYCYMMPVAASDELLMMNRWRPDDTADGDSIIMEAISTDHHILSDGERMYEAEWRKLWLIDSKGVLTAFFTLTTDCPGYNLTEDLLMFTGVQHLTGDWYAIRYQFPQEDAVELYEVIYNAASQEILSAERASLWNPSATGDGTGYYEVDYEKGYVCRHSFTDRDFCEEIYPVMRNMSDLRLSGDKLYFTSNYVSSDDMDYQLSSSAGLGCYCIDLTSEDKNIMPVGKKGYDGPYYLGDSVIYSVHNGDGQWRVCSIRYDEPETEQELFSVQSDQLWNAQTEQDAIGTVLIFTQADNLLIFNLPQPAVNNAEYVQIDGGMQTKYLKHAAPPEDVMGDNSYGYVTEEDDILYIPPEHTAERTDEIQCYRMLPYKNAWESELDPSVFFHFNEDRGDAPRLTKERAKEICDAYGCTEAMYALLEEGGWDVEWTSGILCMEIWLDDQGKEFILVHDTDGISYFRYDDEHRQYFYERWKIPHIYFNHTGDTPSEPYPFSAQYIRTNGYHSGVRYPQVCIIRSREELDDYISRNESLYDFEGYGSIGEADYTPGFRDILTNYTDDWFETHQLVLVLLEETSGSVRHEVTALTQHSVTVKRLVPEIGTEDMAEWHLVIETDKDCQLSEQFTVQLEASGI